MSSLDDNGATNNLPPDEPARPAGLRELMIRTKLGDGQAAFTLRQRTESRVEWAIRRWPYNPGDLPLLLDLTYDSAAKSFDPARCEVDEQVVPFLRGVGVNVRHHFYRDHGVHLPLPENEETVPDPHPLPTAREPGQGLYVRGLGLIPSGPDSELMKHLGVAVRRLGPRRRRIIILRFVAGLDFPDIRQKMGISSIEATRQLLYNALEDLRQEPLVSALSHVSDESGGETEGK